MTGIKVFGERNTGTRAIMRMIASVEGLHIERGNAPHPQFAEGLANVEANERGIWKRIYREALKDARQDSLGPLGAWKHAAPHYCEAYKNADVKVIFMVRNPYSWALSLFRHPYHILADRPRNLTGFLSQRWLTLRRDGLAMPVLDSPMRLWTLKLRAYAAFRLAAGSGRTAIIRFEDFVHAPESELARTLAGFNLPNAPIVALAEPTKPGGQSGADRQRYYAGEVWREALTPTDVALINAMVDWDIAAAHGYQRICPSEMSAPTTPRLQLVR